MTTGKWVALFLSLFLVLSLVPSTGQAESLASPPPAKSSLKKAFLSILHPEPVTGGLTSEDLENAILTSCFDRKISPEPAITVDMKDGIIDGTCDLTIPDEAGKMRYVARIDGNFKPQGKDITFTLKSDVLSYGTLRTVKDGKQLGIWDEDQSETTKYTASGAWSGTDIAIGSATFDLSCLIYMKNLEGDVPYGVGGRCPGSRGADPKWQSDEGSGTGKVTWKLDLAVDTCGDTLQSFNAKNDSQIKIVSIEGEQKFLDAKVIRNGCEVEAEKGMQLKTDDQVATGYKTFMYIDLLGHTVLIPPVTGVSIKTFFLGDVEQIETEIIAGSLSVKTIKEFRPSRFRVTNPTLTASVRGTDFTVSYDPDQKISTVQVAEGIVDVTPSNTALAPVTLEANQQVTVSQTQVGAVQPYSPPPDMQTSFSLRAWFAGERLWMVFSLLALLGILLMVVGIALLRRSHKPLAKVIAFAVVLLPGAAVSVFALLALFR